MLKVSGKDTRETFVDVIPVNKYFIKINIDPTHSTSLFLYPLYPLKTLKKLCFSNVFRGYRKRSVA